MEGVRGGKNAVRIFNAKLLGGTVYPVGVRHHLPRDGDEVGLTCLQDHFCLACVNDGVRQ